MDRNRDTGEEYEEGYFSGKLVWLNEENVGKWINVEWHPDYIQGYKDALRDRGYEDSFQEYNIQSMPKPFVKRFTELEKRISKYKEGIRAWDLKWAEIAEKENLK